MLGDHEILDAGVCLGLQEQTASTLDRLTAPYRVAGPFFVEWISWRIDGFLQGPVSWEVSILGEVQSRSAISPPGMEVEGDRLFVTGRYVLTPGGRLRYALAATPGVGRFPVGYLYRGEVGVPALWTRTPVVAGGRRVSVFIGIRYAQRVGVTGARAPVRLVSVAEQVSRVGAADLPPVHSLAFRRRLLNVWRARAQLPPLEEG